MDETMADELTTADAAQLAGVSPRTVREWAGQGKIAGRKTPAGLLVERRSLAEHLARRGGASAAPSAAMPATPHVAAAINDVAAPPAVDLAPLVQALERAHAEALMLAGRVTWLERQLQDREAEILQLTAGAADAGEAPADGAADGAEPAAGWWGRFRRWWERGGY